MPRGPLVRLVVTGPSMLPTLSPGEHLLVLRHTRYGEGSLVALTDPARPGRTLVKRVERIGPEGVSVLGDNAGASTDSRHFGPLPRRAVIGRVVYRYAPAAAVGRIPDGYGRGR